MATYVNIMSKVSPETAERMDRAVQALGLRSKYELLQAALALILRYVDPYLTHIFLYTLYYFA